MSVPEICHPTTYQVNSRLRNHIVFEYLYKQEKLKNSFAETEQNNVSILCFPGIINQLCVF